MQNYPAAVAGIIPVISPDRTWPETNYDTSVFSEVEDLRRYLAFLPDERSSLQKLTNWLTVTEQNSQSFLVSDNISVYQKTAEEPSAFRHKHQDTIDHLTARKELLSGVVYHIARLHAAYRETLISLYFEQNTLRETAVLMGKSLSTVKRYRDAGLVDLFMRLKQQELQKYQAN
ncbi:MAG: RNA polymerase sigma factor [Saccharofermentanales bacterium]|jgi:hypothetical protein|nr:hypothetical protein [Bacillota bacterium]